MDEQTHFNRIFVSCVSAEFENSSAPFPGFRTSLSHYLRRADCEVKVQEDFRQTPEDTIAKLDRYIRQCAAVIHIVGGMPGEVANSKAVEAFLAGEPTLLETMPDLREALGDCFDLTYTQWEAFLALLRKVDLYVYATEQAAITQQVHLDRLRKARRHPERFATQDQLFGQLIGDLRKIIPALPDRRKLDELQASVHKLNQRFLSTTNTELINDRPIERKETLRILDAVESSDSHGALLVADAGFGKSCILAQVIDSLQSRKIPFIAFKLDSVPECTSADRLGKELDLPESPVDVLGKIAQGQPCVLIVDQLDAISLVSGRKTNTWIAFDELRREASTCPGMKLVVACRSFDLNQDHRLRPLGADTSGFKKIPVSKLSAAELRAALDQASLSHWKPTQQQSDILTLPFHLALFLQGDPKRPFFRVGDLYRNYWDRKQDDLWRSLDREPRWNEVIDTLTAWMSNHQSLIAPKDVVDQWRADARAMVSHHVLTENENSYQFFHESFFDYAFARHFCRGGQSLLDFLTQAGEVQHLFRRAQVRQILGYRRENRPDEYDRDLRDLLASEDVRFHIRKMVASELRRVSEPTSEEWKIIEPYVLKTDLSRAVSSAMRGHVGWFNLLNQLELWKRWLTSEDSTLINAAIWFLESHELHKVCSEQIASVLEPFAEKGGDWDLRLKRILSWGVAHHSDRMTQLYFGLIRRGIYDEEKRRDSGGDFWSSHHNAEKENPRFIIDLVRCWFLHTLGTYDDGESCNFIDKAPLNKSRTGCIVLGRAAEAEPDYFIEAILPVFIEAVLSTSVEKGDRILNRVWPSLNKAGVPHDINDAIYIYVQRGLKKLARRDSAKFRRIAKPLKQYFQETFSAVLLLAFAENPEEFANECIAYMVAHKPRLNIGYSGWFGHEGHGESALSRTAIVAVSPVCDEHVLRELEDAVIGYCDESERSMPRFRGFAELLVLRSIIPIRRSKHAEVRISELECKFPDMTDVIPPIDKVGLLRAVGSPIEPHRTKLMNNAQWISAMQKYDGSTDRFRGGPIQLSRELTERVREDRIRFANLALSMPSEVDSVYFAAILDGLTGYGVSLSADDKEIEIENTAAIPTELFLKVICRLHELPGKPCGSAISHCIERISERELPDQFLDIVAWYAVNDPDPATDIWQDKVTNYYGGDPWDHGINCVRGQAAGGVAALLWHDDEHTRLPKLLPTVRSLIHDKVLSVRTCAIETLRPLLRLMPDEAISMFIECCGDAEPLWGTAPFERFVYRTINDHYPLLRDLLQLSLKSSNPTAIENAATRIILADLIGVPTGEDAEKIRHGSDAMREAACHVYARNIDNPDDSEVANLAAAYLPNYFNDECEAVRKHAANAFWDISGERLFQLESMILEFIESRSFEADPEDLLQALEESAAELPHVICCAAERILEVVGEEGAHLAHRGAISAHSISTLIVRQYAQTTDHDLKVRCLDLIDRMERIGYLGIADELNKIDR